MRPLQAPLAVAFLALAPFAALAGPCAPVVVTSNTFAASAEGWTSNTPSQVAWAPNGTVGYLRFTDATGDSTYIDAPAAYHGNWSTLNNLGYIAWQHRIFQETGVTQYAPYEIRLSGPGGAAKFDGATTNATTSGWVPVVAPLAAGDWTVTSGSWPALLANVTDLQIDIELVTNQSIPGDKDIEGINKIFLVQEPCQH